MKKGRDCYDLSVTAVSEQENMDAWASMIDKLLALVEEGKMTFHTTEKRHFKKAYPVKNNSLTNCIDEVTIVFRRS